ncbi:hypothetical protein BH10CYA1_BH10CYA1_28020 [soil metagenome]
MNHFFEDQFAVPAYCHTEESLRTRKQLIEFIEIETAAQERDVRQKHDAAVTRRVAKGNAITGLKFQGMDKNFYIYSYKENESGFRDGDILVINERKRRGHDVLNEGVLVWLEKINHREKLIKLEQALDVEPPLTGDCTLDIGFYDYNSVRLTQSVNRAYALDVVPKLLEGRASIPLCQTLIESETNRLHVEIPSLTQRQCVAVASAKYRPVTLIQGPPGTGKSFLLALIIDNALLSGKSVLVTGPSHRVINSLMEAVLRRNTEAPVVKIVSRYPAKLDKRILQVKYDDARLTELPTPYLVGSTVFQAFNLLREKALEFDLVVIDEAGQMPVVHGMPAFLHADKFVIAGDHKQLAPIIHAPERHPDYLQTSLFEQLHKHYPSSTLMLDVTFRMNKGINEFPSREFYDGELKPAPSAADKKFRRPATERGKFFDIITRDEAVTFVELNHEGCRRSEDEAELVAKLAKELIQHHKISSSELAIIAPIKAHNESIRSKLSALVKQDSTMKPGAMWDLVIDTVHRLQGQEREVVIFSLGSSDRNYLINCRNLFFDPHLMNVAITRSKTRLFIVASKYFFPNNAGIVIDAQHLLLWERYYEYLVEDNHRVIYDQRQQVLPALAKVAYLLDLPGSHQSRHVAFPNFLVK